MIMSPYQTPAKVGSTPSAVNKSMWSRSDMEKASNMKAELVRNELLTRSDLMKLYQPPLKKSQLPTNNPFYTKTLIQGASSPYRDGMSNSGEKQSY
jgi:hypothetical protein